MIMIMIMHSSIFIILSTYLPENALGDECPVTVTMVACGSSAFVSARPADKSGCRSDMASIEEKYMNYC